MKNQNQTDYILGILGMLVLGVIMITPVDYDRVHDQIDGRGEFAKWFGSDCRAVNQAISEAGGVLPYYTSRIGQHQQWQLDVRTGNNSERRVWEKNRLNQEREADYKRWEAFRRR